MRCLQCGGALAAGGKCTGCDASAGGSGGRSEVMLALANLLRMRGQWSEAADQCADVLRLDPSSPAAHSLLGDIYSDQGRLEEARHWYQQALDLSPGSEADRAKLRRTEEALDSRRQRAEWEAVIEGRSQPVSTSLLVRESVQRIAAIAGAAVCGMILVFATVVSVSERTVISADDQGPVIFPVRRGAARAIPADTHRERLLLKQVTEKLAGQPDQAVRVQVDFREQSAELRLFQPERQREGLNTGQMRERLMRSAYRGAHLLHDADPTLETVRVTVLGLLTHPDGSSRSELLFSGTLAASDLVVAPDAISLEELTQFFRSTGRMVWASGLETPTDLEPPRAAPSPDGGGSSPAMGNTPAPAPTGANGPDPVPPPSGSGTGSGIGVGNGPVNGPSGSSLQLQPGMRHQYQPASGTGGMPVGPRF